jgi:ribosome biogenesis SPOUT family RNA methylase Rps3
MLDYEWATVQSLTRIFLAMCNFTMAEVPVECGYYVHVTSAGNRNVHVLSKVSALGDCDTQVESINTFLHSRRRRETGIASIDRDQLSRLSPEDGSKVHIRFMMRGTACRTRKTCD